MAPQICDTDAVAAGGQHRVPSLVAEAPGTMATNGEGSFPSLAAEAAPERVPLVLVGTPTVNSKSVRRAVRQCSSSGDIATVRCFIEEMVRSNSKISRHTFECVIEACARVGDASQAMATLPTMVRAGCPPTSRECDAVLLILVQTGRLSEAEAWLQKLLCGQFTYEPNVMSFNSLIQAHAAVYSVERAEHWFLEMLKAGIGPNETTYGAMCRVYAHKGDYWKVTGIMESLPKMGLRANEHFYAALSGAPPPWL